MPHNYSIFDQEHQHSEKYTRIKLDQAFTEKNKEMYEELHLLN